MSIVKVLNMLCIWVETCALIYSTRRALWAVTEFKQSSGVFVKPKPQQPVSQAEDVLWCIQVVERLLSWILEQYFNTTLTKFSCYVSVQTGPFKHTITWTLVKNVRSHFNQNQLLLCRGAVFYHLCSLHLYRMARQHCILQAWKAMSRLLNFSWGERLMWTIRRGWDSLCVFL